MWDQKTMFQLFALEWQQSDSNFRKIGDFSSKECCLERGFENLSVKISGKKL